MIQLYNANCLEQMKSIEDKSIDLILCDLPYGTTACKWDSVIPFVDLWEQYNRIIKDNCAIVLFGCEPFSSKLRLSNLKNYKYDWLWNKKSAGNMLNAKYQPLKTFENIMVFSNGRCRYYPIFEYGHKDRTNDKPREQKTDLYGKIKTFEHTAKNKPADARYPKAIIEISKQATECSNSKALHPTQKPVALLEYLIKTYTQEGDLVLDNCMGSGSTGVACKHLKRDFIGIEIDENYFKIAEERIKNED